MKTASAMLALLLCLGSIFSPLFRSEDAPASPVQKRAAAYYFYWYRQPDNHWVCPDCLTDHPPDAYVNDSVIAYSWADPNWHRRELLDLMAAGIEIVLPVYWGDTSNLYWSNEGLDKLVLAEQSLIADGKSPPQIGMFYDTSALKAQNGTPPDLTTTAGKGLFFSMIQAFFDRIPDHSLWAKVDGHPLIYLYDSPYVSDYNQGSFDYVEQQFNLRYGETPYIVREISWQGVQTDGVYAWGAAVNGPTFFGDLASIGPGYDDRPVRPNDPTYRDRECGEFYRDSWEQVIDSPATLLTVETWNEFHEATDVAPSREYGRQYLELTTLGIQSWKQADLSARPYAWLDLGRYPYAQGLRVAINQYDGAWKTTYLAGRQAAYPDHTSTPAPSNHIYLDLDNAFIFNTPSHVWVTVEYFDGGSDGWMLEYDSASDPFKEAPWVNLQNTGEWKRITFDLADALFGNRQQGTLSDLRLVDGYDGVTNYFGRVWVFKTDPAGLVPPNLTGMYDLMLQPGSTLDIPLTASDPGGVPTITLDRAPAFASLTGGGQVLHLAPSESDASNCVYRLRVVVRDEGQPALMDAETISVRVSQAGVYLPLVVR